MTTSGARNANHAASLGEGVSLLVLIVCYRAVDLTIDCLVSLEREIPTVPGARVVIVENGTGKGASATLRKEVTARGWEGWVEIREISPNRGFSGGNNAVLEEVVQSPFPPESVLLLNADTILRAGSLKKLYDSLSTYPEAGVISPRLEWPDGTPQISCFRDFHPLVELDKAAGLGVITRLLQRYVTAIPVTDMPSRPDWTSFACALIRRDTLLQIGVLDPGFFLYFDDPDYCRRARREGFVVVNVPDAHVVHLRGRSNPLKELTREHKRRPWYHFASRTRYYAKHYGWSGLLAANLLWALGHAIAWLRRLATGLEVPACEHEAQDIWTNFFHPMAMPSRSQDGDASPAAR